jgi:hypothetical protein
MWWEGPEKFPSVACGCFQATGPLRNPLPQIAVITTEGIMSSPHVIADSLQPL